MKCSSNHFFEVGVGFKAVHVAGHHLLAEGIVRLSQEGKSNACEMSSPLSHVQSNMACNTQRLATEGVASNIQHLGPVQLSGYVQT